MYGLSYGHHHHHQQLLLLEPSLLGSLRRVWVKPSDDAHLGQTKAIGLSRVLPISTLTTTTMGNYHGP
jgi:hypothetical protein